MNQTATSPSISTILSCIDSIWPEHTKFVEKSFRDRDQNVLNISEQLASYILALEDESEDGLIEVCLDYKFLCEKIVLPEEMHFRRHGTYRLSSFEEANAECYANPSYMSRYMNGLLVSDVLWSNHAHAFAYFVNNYLPRLPMGAAHLEVGPGHGLFLHFAAENLNVSSVTGWDVSPTSIEMTREALSKLGSRLSPELKLQNLFDAPPAEFLGSFDSITLSEILEHLEDPVGALVAATKHLKPGGLVFVNVPANSPAPDHIFLFHSPEHAADVVREAGLIVLETAAYPMSGATLERARKHKLAISCVVTAQKPLG